MSNKPRDGGKRRDALRRRRATLERQIAQAGQAMQAAGVPCDAERLRRAPDRLALERAAAAYRAVLAAQQSLAEGGHAVELPALDAQLAAAQHQAAAEVAADLGIPVAEAAALLERMLHPPPASKGDDPAR